MDDGPYLVILLMYGSHDMRHTGFRWLTLVKETPGFWGVTGAALIDVKKRELTLRVRDEAVHFNLNDSLK